MNVGYNREEPKREGKQQCQTSTMGPLCHHQDVVLHIALGQVTSLLFTMLAKYQNSKSNFMQYNVLDHFQLCL
jgi:hypothetical protein